MASPNSKPGWRVGRWLALAVVGWWLPAAAWAEDYCVAPGGDDDQNTGLHAQDPPASPATECFASPARAVQTAGPGDTVCFMTGTWMGPVTFSSAGSAQSPIVWRACAGERPKINQRPDVGDPVTLRVTGAYQIFRDLVTEVYYGMDTDLTAERIWYIEGSHVTLDGVTVEGMNASGRELGGDYRVGEPCLWECDDKVSGVHVANGAQYVTIQNSTIRHMSKMGITFDSTAFHGRVLGSRVYDVADRTVEVAPCDNNGCGTYTDDFNQSYQIRGLLLENNFLCGVWREDAVQTTPDPRYWTQSDPIDVRKQPLSTPGLVFRHNVVCSINENTLDLKGGTKWLAEGNVVFGLAQGNVFTHGSGAESGENIARNNVVFDSASGSGVFGLSSTYNNTTLYNRRSRPDVYQPPIACGTGTGQGLILAYSRYGFGEALNNAVGNEPFAMNLQQYRYGTRIDGNVYWNDVEGAARFYSSNEVELNNNGNGVDFATWQQVLTGRVEGADQNGEELAGTGDYFAEPAGLAQVCCPYCTGNVDPSNLSNFWTDALLTWHLGFNFTPQAVYKNRGVPLTHAAQAGSGTTVLVDSARGFYDGTWAPEYTQGDLVVIGDLVSGTLARVVGRDMTTTPHQLFIDAPATWTQGTPVDVVYEVDMMTGRPSSTSRNQGAFHFVQAGDDPPGTPDAGPTGGSDGGTGHDEPGLHGGCGCQLGREDRHSPAPWIVLGLLVLVTRRRGSRRRG